MKDKIKQRLFDPKSIGNYQLDMDIMADDLLDLFKQWALEMVGEDYEGNGAVERILNNQLKEIRDRIEDANK